MPKPFAEVHNENIPRLRISHHPVFLISGIPGVKDAPGFDQRVWLAGLVKAPINERHAPGSREIDAN